MTDDNAAWRARIDAAAARLEGRIRATPLIELGANTLPCPGHVALKLESLQMEKP